METNDDRPGIWIGHVTRRVNDVKNTADFFQQLGLRLVWADARMAILELRGGTHLLLFPDRPQYKTVTNDEFDFMVADVQVSHELLQSKGIKVAKVKRDRFHAYFEASDPDGNKWRINSDHTEGRSV
jgi:catechol 2,3-dioxygenase-like lactoylglutathione lyase family enzyme